ncbi:MAG: hypothetical protein SH847_09185, partial [Roseiflexaceae bacterium]|nr:hypothetical protein [Roseiflexaceae bacterium]
MRRISAPLLFLFLLPILAACTDSNGNGSNGTPQPPSNALKITIAYSPEKETWLKERITVFNNSRTKIGDQVAFVEGVNKSSGAARTEIKNGSLK